VVATGHGVSVAAGSGAPISVGDQAGRPSFPALDLAPGDVALIIDGIPYPRVIVQGHLEFTRGQAEVSGDPRSFYEWGEILHLYDTAAERVLGARAAWNAGFRVTPEDRKQFDHYSLESTPTYLQTLYGGPLEAFRWDADLQILMKKWMVYVTMGRRDVSWVQAGEMITASAQEFATWDAWLRPAMKRARIITYPERIERRGEAAPQVRVLFLVFLGVGALALWLRGVARNRECNLCLACVHACERRSLALRVRDFLTELSSVRRPRLAVAVLAAMLVGVVAVQNLGMLEIAGVLERRLREVTGLGRMGVATVLYLAAVALPVALLAASARGDRGRMALYGYALIPLDLGAHAAHNLLHLLGEGKSVWWVTVSLLGISSPLHVPGGHPGGSMGASILDAPTIKVLQVALLLPAATGSLVVARRMQRRQAPVDGSGGGFSARPLFALVLLFLAVNLWLFSVPMALRH
jgi:hypothetical protein